MGTNFQRKFSSRFKKEFKWFLGYDRFMAAKVKTLIADTLAHPTYGLGHPERLRHRKGNEWSRRIDKKHRLVYEIIGNVINDDEGNLKLDAFICRMLASDEYKAVYTQEPSLIAGVKSDLEKNLSEV
ncbi:MAG: Txe/YoeB family addiction module toxin [Puniceicoccales bacterium]|jgi:toxin YoeB|nr:Txe/YoeB family addiction module toxin [Puniceicoccales bacterium]